MFVTFEGSDGTGKTTQVNLLSNYLEQLGYAVVLTREPGGTQIGEQIRQVLSDFRNADMQKRTEILLFQASRAQLVEQVIRPQLEQGSLVLCDRYGDSTLAYQGYGYQSFDLEKLRGLVDFATGGLKPAITFLFDMDVDKGLQRRAQDGQINRLDKLDREIYQRVRKGYLEMAAAEPGRLVIIDANRPVDVVQEEIRAVLVKRLKGMTQGH